MKDPLRVCVDARLIGGTYGGVQHFIVGLAAGLSALKDGDENYLFLTYTGADEWLRPYLHGPCSILPGPMPPRAEARWKPFFRSALPSAYSVWRRVREPSRSGGVPIPSQGGMLERARVNLVHFTNQQAFSTTVTSIYHPHDLQHLHLPEFFRPRDIAIREVQYRAFCEQASMVAVASSWTKRDVIAQYNLPAEKVKVVPLAPVLNAYPNPSRDDLEAARNKFRLPLDYVYYPAQTFAHKNHIGLLEALTVLRDRDGQRISLVSSGKLTEFLPTIMKTVHALHLENQVHFLGFVSPMELQCLYKLCRCVVIPTKFEAASFPLWEAFASGAPAACSNVTSLPDQAGDAALIFNPDKPEEIADAILSLWKDNALRQELITRGARNVARFTWETTARMFRAHYRRLSGCRLTMEDQDLIHAVPLL